MKVIRCVLLITVLYFNWCEANLCLMDPSSNKVVEFMNDYPYCKIITKSKEIEDLLKEYPERFSVVNEETLDNLEETCKKKPEHGFIYPGTLWCGRGTKARDYNQLGVHNKEDSCCREHDNCPNFIAAGGCKGGVCNTSRFTRSHCTCDKKFQECLRNTGTETGNTIGAIFFNVAELLCFQETANCTAAQRVPIEEGSNALTCPYDFLNTGKYVFSPPYYTLKNRKAFYLNMILRKFKWWS